MLQFCPPTACGVLGMLNGRFRTFRFNKEVFTTACRAFPESGRGSMDAGCIAQMEQQCADAFRQASKRDDPFKVDSVLCVSAHRDLPPLNKPSKVASEIESDDSTAPHGDPDNEVERISGMKCSEAVKLCS